MRAKYFTSNKRDNNEETGFFPATITIPPYQERKETKSSTPSSSTDLASKSHEFGQNAHLLVERMREKKDTMDNSPSFVDIIFDTFLRFFHLQDGRLQESVDVNLLGKTGHDLDRYHHSDHSDNGEL